MVNISPKSPSMKVLSDKWGFPGFPLELKLFNQGRNCGHTVGPSLSMSLEPLPGLYYKDRIIDFHSVGNIEQRLPGFIWLSGTRRRAISGV